MAVVMLLDRNCLDWTLRSPRSGSNCSHRYLPAVRSLATVSERVRRGICARTSCKITISKMINTSAQMMVPIRSDALDVDGSAGRIGCLGSRRKGAPPAMWAQAQLQLQASREVVTVVSLSADCSIASASCWSWAPSASGYGSGPSACSQLTVRSSRVAMAISSSIQRRPG
jgi:hypothetical protein